MPENTLGQRMRIAAQHARLTAKVVGIEVAKMTNRPLGPYTEQAVGQWYSDKSEPEMPALVAFSRLVNADLVWLLTGIGGRLGQLPREGRIVPTITMQQALRQPIDYTSQAMVHTYYPCSDKAFIVAITDTRNDPVYKVGYKVVIDPLAPPRPDRMVLACINGEAVFGEYIEQPGKRIVRAINASKWPEETLVTKRGDRIIGTMTEFAAPGP